MRYSVLEAYRAHVEERQSENIPPKPLTPEWTSELVEMIKNPPAGEEDFFSTYLLIAFLRVSMRRLM